MLQQFNFTNKGLGKSTSILENKYLVIGFRSDKVLMKLVHLKEYVKG